jgi:tRNA(fMet)-specific endonuclease VapC
MDYLLDTNILLNIIRNSDLYQKTDKRLGFFQTNNNSFISIVSAGEIKSLAIRNGWGPNKNKILDGLLKLLVPVPINNSIVEIYAEIDAFSQGKHPNKTLGLSPRNMGKNDIWIAATANILNATLVTTDADFEHLQSNFITVTKVD